MSIFSRKLHFLEKNDADPVFRMWWAVPFYAYKVIFNNFVFDIMLDHSKDFDARLFKTVADFGSQNRNYFYVLNKTYVCYFEANIHFKHIF